MIVTAQQIRTGLAITAAGASIVAALLLSPRSKGITDDCCAKASNILTARLLSTEIVGSEQDIAVTITMPGGHTQARPPLSLAVVIDRSGSMEGEPLANAKAAAANLVAQLDERDAFTIVTYSSADETVVPMTRATAAAKAAARDAIDRIWDDGNTCISCGISRGAAELATSPVHDGLRRMVLISDGQANTGLWDRNDLAQLATETATRGISISTVGVGLDFDEVTMTELADVGHGHYYFVEDTAKLGQMFERELGGLAETVAADVRLVVTDMSGTIEEAYGYPMIRQGHEVIVPIADLRAGETRKVVLRSTIDTSNTGKLAVAQFALHWRRTSDGGFDQTRTQLDTIVVRDLDRVRATIDRGAVNIVEQARAARVLEQATTVYETQGSEAAQKLIERNLRDVRANGALDVPSVQAIEAASTGAIDNFAKAPAAKAKKATRADAYKLSH
ncbi:MAG TPA: VWA domain-containing protein [Kofleriaceae bacterium]